MSTAWNTKTALWSAWLIAKAVVRNDFGQYQHEYVLRDHLGNTRVTFRDGVNKGNVPNNASYDDGVVTKDDIVQINHYYPFGLNMEGDWNGSQGKNKYQYNGKEWNDDFGLGWNDYGARFYDPAIARWNCLDALSDKYFSISPYVYVVNRPINAIDPDGKRVYFIGGAANDQDGWEYIKRWGNAFQSSGVEFWRVNASEGKAGDIAFTTNYRHSAYEPKLLPVHNQLSPSIVTEYKPVENERIDAVTKFYEENLKQNPLKEGEQFNLVGYSYGSVMQAQAAIRLADAGYKIDNVVLIGSPVSDKSDLWKQLQSHKNIKNVIRYDIKGDLLSNPQDVLDFLQGAKQNRTDAGPHFDAARSGEKADKLMQTIVNWLKEQGVKN